MASKQVNDKFAAEAVQRFEDFTKWAIQHWPNRNFPLLQSDFIQSRKEIRLILGDKLGEGDTGGPDDTAQDSTAQYVNMNPTPWP